jgi:hypothetical protein
MKRVLAAMTVGAVGGLVLFAGVFYAWLLGCPGIDHDIDV